MPKITDIGTAGAANAAIGGVPTLYYFDFASKGRGEVLRLFFEDSGIAFKDHRWSSPFYKDKIMKVYNRRPSDLRSFEERNKEMDDAKRANVNPVGSLPYLDLNGKILTQSYPLLRYLSGKLGKYDGKTAEEKYFVDIICDLVIDWRTKFVDTAFVTDKNGLNQNEDGHPFQNHKTFSMLKFIKGVEGQLAASPYGGPFVLGETCTYADFVLFQQVHDENAFGGIHDTLAESAPRISALYKAVAARPNVAAYFASARYYD
ncbi:hypothetical protein RQP46_005699 [Phenoliferia psychrophenolica]